MCTTPDSVLVTAPSTFDAEAAGLGRLANQLGIEAQVLDAAQTAALEPGVKMSVAGSLYFPIDAHITPPRFMSGLRTLPKGLGVSFQWSTSVTGWRSEAGRVVAARTTSGELAADEFVLAGGSWSDSIVKGLGIRLPMQAGKGYSHTLDNPRLRFTKPVYPGDTMRVRLTVKQKTAKDTPEGGIPQGVVEWDVTD